MSGSQNPCRVCPAAGLIRGAPGSQLQEAAAVPGRPASACLEVPPSPCGSSWGVAIRPGLGDAITPRHSSVRLLHIRASYGTTTRPESGLHVTWSLLTPRAQWHPWAGPVENRTHPVSAPLSCPVWHAPHLTDPRDPDVLARAVMWQGVAGVVG